MEVGGSGVWYLNVTHASRCRWVVVTRNTVRARAEANDPNWGFDFAECPEKHRSAFMIGELAGVSPSTTWPGRFLLEFSRYALIDIPNASTGRNPVGYANLADFNIDPAKLNWKPMPPRKLSWEQPGKVGDDVRAEMTDAEGPRRRADHPAKHDAALEQFTENFRAELARKLEVPGENIAITVDALGNGKLLFHF